MNLLTDDLYERTKTNPETVYAAFYETVKAYDDKQKEEQWHDRKV